MPLLAPMAIQPTSTFNWPPRLASPRGVWPTATMSFPLLPLGPPSQAICGLRTSINCLTAHFVIYYSATTKHNPNQHCVGAAISKTVAGPYIPLNTTIACNHAKGGAIDPDGF